LQISSAHVRQAALVFSEGELEVQLVREVHTDWSANLHLRLLALAQDFADFREQLRSKFTRKKSARQQILLMEVLLQGMNPTFLQPNRFYPNLT